MSETQGSIDPHAVRYQAFKSDNLAMCIISMMRGAKQILGNLIDNQNLVQFRLSDFFPLPDGGASDDKSTKAINRNDAKARNHYTRIREAGRGFCPDRPNLASEMAYGEGNQRRTFQGDQLN